MQTLDPVTLKYEISILCGRRVRETQDEKWVLLVGVWRLLKRYELCGFCLSRLSDVTMELARELLEILFKSLVFLHEVRRLSLVSL